jgi:hypothetical protein
METFELIVIAAVAAGALLVFLVLFGMWRRRRRRDHLQERFGPEYDRTVSAEGRRSGERQLQDVEKQHEDLDIRPLSSSARDRYLNEWRQAESRFVADPEDSARAAERVVARMLAECGYPTSGSTEDQAAYLAADHPDVAERYRHGNAMLEADGNGHQTENLRRAVLDFRAVLDELVEVDDRSRTPA